MMAPNMATNEAPSGVSGRKIKGPYSHHGRQSGGHQESSSKEHGEYTEMKCY